MVGHTWKPITLKTEAGGLLLRDKDLLFYIYPNLWEMEAEGPGIQGMRKTNDKN